MDSEIKLIQREQILAFLESHPDGATVRELTVELDINSPTKRVSELGKLGYPIEKVWVHRINSRGERKRFVRYRLKKETA